MGLMARRVKRDNDVRPADVRMLGRGTAANERRLADGRRPFVVAGKSVAVRATTRVLVVRIEQTRSSSAREIAISHDCIHDDSDVYHMTEGREGKLVVHEWLGIKEGLPPAEK